jgi:hypothetical protein
MVHHGTIHMGHRRDGGQFHQPFPLKIAVNPWVMRSSHPRASISAS